MCITNDTNKQHKTITHNTTQNRRNKTKMKIKDIKIGMTVKWNNFGKTQSGKVIKILPRQNYSAEQQPIKISINKKKATWSQRQDNYIDYVDIASLFPNKKSMNKKESKK